MSCPNRNVSSQAGLPFMTWSLTDTWLNSFLSQLQAWFMSQFIADAAHVLLEEDDARYPELVAPFSRVP